ncbi:MAG: LuxR C-terminal-related transcriptional regulator [Methylovirgula sp.]
MSQTTGMTGNADRPLLRLNDREWFSRLGEVAKSIGSREFHHELVDLFGASIRHESCWAIRFSRAAAPEVLFTHNVAEDVVSTYSHNYSGLDPFSDFWQEQGRAGVIMLAEAKACSIRTEAYSRVFLPNAKISDEMSIFLPTVGNDCYGLFLEREQGLFSRADVERARLVFPALEGCHRAHMGWMFDNLHKSSNLEFSGLANKPLLIQDRFGLDVYANDAWSDAVAADGAIANLVGEFSACDHGQARVLDGCVLKFESLRGDFPLAPHGRLFVLEPRNSSPRTVADISLEIAAPAELTPRERDIFELIMNGRTTGQIAQALKISKGVIKNYKQRIYRKVNVDSERALVRKFAPPLRRIDASTW